MIETSCLKNAIFFQTIISFALSRKIIKFQNLFIFLIVFEGQLLKKSNDVFWRHICSSSSVDHGLKIEIYYQICNLDNGSPNRGKMMNLREKKQSTINALCLTKNESYTLCWHYMLSIEHSWWKMCCSNT